MKFREGEYLLCSIRALGGMDSELNRFWCTLSKEFLCGGSGRPCLEKTSALSIQFSRPGSKRLVECSHVSIRVIIINEKKLHYAS
jgi:hypothetical protein